MRASHDSQWLKNKEDASLSKENYYGVCLGADFTSEHEHGINGIKTYFGIELKKAFGIKSVLGLEKEVLGIEKRRIKEIPKLFLKETDGYIGIVFDNFMRSDEEFKYTKQEIPFHFKKDLACAWDADSFAVFMKKEFKEYCDELYEAIMNKDIAIYVGGMAFLKTVGIVIPIISKMPQEIKDRMYQTDIDNYDLKKAVEKTKIHERLKSANKDFFALSPRWKDDNKKEIHFWLNPLDQQSYNCGWFSIKDLEDWMKEKGRIIKNG